MLRHLRALAALLVLAPAVVALPAAAEAPPRSGNPVFDRTVDHRQPAFLRSG